MLYDRLVKLCKDNGTTLSELMIKLDMSKSTATKWKQGKNDISNPTLKKIADYFGMTVEELEKGKTDTKEKLAAKSNELPPNAIPFNITGMVPVLGSIPAGYPALASEEILGYIPVTVHNPQDCFGLIVKGDSMINAGIQPGDMVLLRHQPTAENGQIVACRVNGEEATLKRFRRGKDSVLLIPENPQYEPRIVPMSDFESGYAAIVGVAIQIIRNI